jgi:probable phosphoglycerate mutase
LQEKEIYLIRHGETDYNLSGRVQGSGIDAPLNEKGRRQANAFYQQYKHLPFDKIYVSKLRRAMESVEGFAALGIPVERHEGLNEINWGHFEGLSIAEMDQSYYQQMTQAWREGYTEMPIKGGESPEDVAARQKAVIELIFSRTDEKIILICMHGRAMRILLCQLLGRPIHKMDDFQHNNLGLYHLSMKDGQLKLVKENCLLHLNLLL